MAYTTKEQVSVRKGKTLEQIYGEEKAAQIRARQSESHLGHIPWNKGTRTHKNCLGCNKDFVYNSKPDQKFCSRECFKQHASLTSPKTKFKKGAVPYNLGVPMSEYTKRKLKEANTGRPSSKKGKKFPQYSGENHPLYGKTHSLETKQKMKLARKKGLEEGTIQIWNKDKAFLAIRGDKHHNWQGGSSFEPYGPRFNNIFKRAIRKRDNQICMLCGVHKEKLSRALSIHHINYNKKLSVPENCVSLCVSCHTKTNKNRKHWMNFFQSLLSEKYNYEYLNYEIMQEVKNIGVYYDC